MGKKVSTEQFIERAREVHGNKYDYSKVEYIDNKTKVCIICPKHGEFWQIPNSHLKGCGCFQCGVENSAKGHLSNKDEFVKKAKNIFGVAYDYSNVIYNKSSEKIHIKCNKCGNEFLITPNNHLKGQGCPICAKERKGRQKKQTQQFIKEAREIHGDKYDYSKVNYIDSKTKVCIMCPKHGEFLQKPSYHLVGNGCPNCGIESMSKKAALTKEEFIEKARKVHGDKYDYSKVKYINNSTKICIICPKHGEFWQTPLVHLNGSGCYKCGREKTIESIILTENEFIEKAKLVHDNTYDYSNVKYINNRTKVCIICPKHGEFWQTPSNHLNGQGCPACNSSKLEENLLLTFDKNEIKAIKQYKFKELGRQHLDFYLPKYNIAIECQGRQHIYPIYFGGKRFETLDLQLKHIQTLDQIKKEICDSLGIKLLYYISEDVISDDLFKINIYNKNNSFWDVNDLIRLINAIKNENHQ